MPIKATSHIWWAECAVARMSSALCSWIIRDKKLLQLQNSVYYYNALNRFSAYDARPARHGTDTIATDSQGECSGTEGVAATRRGATVEASRIRDRENLPQVDKE